MVAACAGRYEKDDEADHQNESGKQEDGARLSYGICKRVKEKCVRLRQRGADSRHTDTERERGSERERHREEGS